LAIFRRREIIDLYTDTHHSTKLRPRSHGAGFDGFILDVIAREERKRTNRKQPDHNAGRDNNFVSSLKQRIPEPHVHSLIHQFAGSQRCHVGSIVQQRLCLVFKRLSGELMIRWRPL
jgi:hypothetical protein